MQTQKIINHLRRHGSIDWLTALKLYGIGGGFRARISELKKDRHNIVSIMITKKGKFGKKTYAKYVLK